MKAIAIAFLTSLTLLLASPRTYGQQTKEADEDVLEITALLKAVKLEPLPGLSVSVLDPRYEFDTLQALSAETLRIDTLQRSQEFQGSTGIGDELKILIEMSSSEQRSQTAKPPHSCCLRHCGAKS